jgi:hypothetical protein
VLIDLSPFHEALNPASAAKKHSAVISVPVSFLGQCWGVSAHHTTRA